MRGMNRKLIWLDDDDDEYDHAHRMNVDVRSVVLSIVKLFAVHAEVRIVLIGRACDWKPQSNSTQHLLVGHVRVTVVAY